MEVEGDLRYREYTPAAPIAAFARLNSMPPQFWR
jgi:hypothetical protein